MGMGWDGFMEGLQRVSIFDGWRTYGWLLKGVSTDMINDGYGLFFFLFFCFFFFFHWYGFFLLWYMAFINFYMIRFNARTYFF
jgi:hypothetical protein